MYFEFCYEVDTCLLLLCHLDELTFYHYEMSVFISANISILKFILSDLNITNLAFSYLMFV